MATKVLLADDHNLVRQGFKALLESRGMEVVADVTDGRQALALAKKLSVDVAIIDIAMPDMNGIEATRQILLASPKVKVIGLSMHADRRYVLGMLRAGATGYLLKDCACEELTQAVHEVLKGDIYLSPRLARTILKDWVNQTTEGDSSAFSHLTEREIEVLKYLTEGQSVAHIASSLCVSVKTVETHRQKIMTKTGVHSIAELTKYALREGLTTLGG